MSSSIFARLEALIKKLGLSAEAGTFTRAELKAYAAGISLAEKAIENALKNVFIDTADNTGLALFLSMISEKPKQTEELSKSAVIDAVSDVGAIYAKDKFDSYLRIMLSCGPTPYVINGNSMDFNYIGIKNKGMLEEYSKLINDFNPCTVYVDNNGTGLHFYEWNIANLRWFEIDSFSVPFLTIEKID